MLAVRAHNTMLNSMLNNPDRLAALRQTDLLDSPPEPSFDRLTRLAARLCAAPIALVSLVDDHRQFFKSSVGLTEPWVARRETPLSHSFCQHVVASAAPLVVPDARAHPLVSNSQAIDELDIIAYTGVPLITSAGQTLGALCVSDHVPRHWAEADVEALADIAAAVMTEITLRGTIAEQRAAESALQRTNVDLVALTEQLSRSRNLLRALFDGLDDGMALLDAEARILTTNQAFAAMLGTTASAIAYQLWSALPADSLTRALGSVIVQSLCDGRPRRRREQATALDGRRWVFDVQVLPLAGGERAVDQLVIRVTDITEQLALEALALQSERYIASGKLAATIAHELNTPLQSIKSCLFFVGESEPSTRETYLALAREELDRVSTILRQMLDLHRPTSGEPILFDLHALLDRVLLLTGSTLAERGIDLVRRDASELPPLLGWPDKITQVLLNLILNAADAMPGGGQLQVRTRVLTPSARSARSGDQTAPIVLLEVQDDGAGIAAELQSRIFEPFFTTKANGLGIGLAVSQKIIAQHGGQIRLDSAPAVGSTFTIALPLDMQELDRS